jgi:hypothetical protein
MNNGLCVRSFRNFRTLVRNVREKQQKGAIGFNFDSAGLGSLQRRGHGELMLLQ